MSLSRGNQPNHSFSTSLSTILETASTTSSVSCTSSQSSGSSKSRSSKSRSSRKSRSPYRSSSASFSSSTMPKLKAKEVKVRKGKNGQKCYRYVPKQTRPIEANYIDNRSRERYDRMKIQAKCICTRTLIKRVLKSECLFCDECEEIIEMNHEIWSCPKGDKSHRHENGYDICRKCAINIIVKQFQKQTQIPNYNHYEDDDRLPSSGECGVACIIQ